VSSTAVQFADVALVPFPFTDQSSSKQRPAVIVSNATYHQERRDVILMPVTSNNEMSMTARRVITKPLKAIQALPDTTALVRELRQLIGAAQHAAAVAVNVSLTALY